MDALGFGVKRSLYKGRDLFSKNQIALSTLQGVFGIHASLSVCTKSEILGTFFLVGDPGVGKSPTYGDWVLKYMQEFVWWCLGWSRHFQ